MLCYRAACTQTRWMEVEGLSSGGPQQWGGGSKEMGPHPPEGDRKGFKEEITLEMTAKDSRAVAFRR